MLVTLQEHTFHCLHDDEIEKSMWRRKESPGSPSPPSRAPPVIWASPGIHLWGHLRIIWPSHGGSSVGHLGIPGGHLWGHLRFIWASHGGSCVRSLAGQQRSCERGSAPTTFSFGRKEAPLRPPCTSGPRDLAAGRARISIDVSISITINISMLKTVCLCV